MCSGSKKEHMEEPHASQASDTSETGSLSSPVPAPPPPIAPGTAQVTAILLSAEEAENSHRCTLRINQVLGYGSSTPPLPSGSEIEVIIPVHVITSMEPATSIEALMAPERPLKLVLKHIGMAQMLGSNSPDWRVASITR